jgi:DNA-binding HxlR family transcriptional regulator
MPKQPIEFMFSPYRRQVLAALFLRPGEKFHVRELERMTGVSAGSLHRELKAMAESGLLLRKKLGNQVFYQVNADCTIYEELAAIFRKTMGMTSRIDKWGQSKNQRRNPGTSCLSIRVRVWLDRSLRTYTRSETNATPEIAELAIGKAIALAANMAALHWCRVN